MGVWSLGWEKSCTVVCRREDLEEIARLLDAGANKEWRSAHGWTPIIAAAFHGCLATVKLLADRGADKSARDNTGMTALILAGASWTEAWTLMQ